MRRGGGGDGWGSLPDRGCCDDVRSGRSVFDGFDERSEMMLGRVSDVDDERADNNTGVDVIEEEVRFSGTGRSVNGTGSDRKSIVLESSAQSSSSSSSSVFLITGDVVFELSDLEETPAAALTTGSEILLLLLLLAGVSFCCCCCWADDEVCERRSGVVVCCCCGGGDGDGLVRLGKSEVERAAERNPAPPQAVFCDGC